MGTGRRAGPKVFPSTCFHARRPLKLCSQAHGVGRSLLPSISSLPLSGRRGKILSLKRKHPLLPTWLLPALEEPDESAVCVPPPQPHSSLSSPRLVREVRRERFHSLSAEA